MKKYIIPGVITLGVIACIIAGFVLYRSFHPHETYAEANNNAKIAIKKIVDKKYPGYEIISLNLEYVDWSSTVQSVNTFGYDFDYATRAEVIIKNNEEERGLHFEGKSRRWRITSDYPISGPNVPDGKYFVEIWTTTHYGNKNEATNYYWVVPDKMNDLYESGVLWYVSNVFKTENHQVYVFNKKTNNWEPSSIKYIDLNYYGNYEEKSKEFVSDLLSRYASYNEE